jgi:hypothetical protein
MAFDQATNFIRDYLGMHASQVQRVERLDWAVQYPVPDTVDAKFDSTTENSVWNAMYESDAPDINNIIGVRTKIAWLAAARRDMRTQFGAALECRLRVHHDQHRLALSGYGWAYNGMTRLMQLINEQRSQALT